MSWRATTLFVAASLALAIVSATEYASVVRADGSRAVSSSEEVERKENVAFALAEINRLSALQLAAASSSSSSSSSHIVHSPVYEVHSVFHEELHESEADIPTLVPVYRTVRGYDEKRRRPVLYQTLVHEERYTRGVVDKSRSYHLVLSRKESPVQTDLQREEREHARKRECAAASGGVCQPHSTPSPLEFVHVFVTVSTDKTLSRSVTKLRFANEAERSNWWHDYLAKEEENLSGQDSKHTMSTFFAKMHESYERSLKNNFMSLSLTLSLPSLPLLSENDISHSKVGSLKVMSVNIWNYNYWLRRKYLLTDEIKQNSPDIIGFQEVRAVKHGPGNGQGRWQINDLAALLPQYEYVYEPAMGFKEGQDFVHEGLAIFSRYPILETTALRLSRDHMDGQDFHQRLALRARVQTPQGCVNFLTTHLSLSFQARMRTLPEVGEFASSFLPEPTIVVGDFNSVYEEGPSVLTVDSAQGRFIDAWGELNGFSEEADTKGWTFNSWNHRSRIDFVFYRGSSAETTPSLKAEQVLVVGKEGVSLRGEDLPGIAGVTDMKDTMFPSDHMFLVSNFRMVRGSDEQVTAAAEAAAKRKPLPSSYGADTVETLSASVGNEDIEDDVHLDHRHEDL